MAERDVDKSRTVTVTTSAAGVALPDELLRGIGVADGDTLHVRLGDDGLLLSKGDPEESEQTRVMREVMHRRRAVLKRLAE